MAIERALVKSQPVLLRGEQRSGRSELARAAVETATRLLWLDFDTNSQLPAASVLNAALSSQLVPKHAKAMSDFGQLVDQIPQGLVLVLDNIDAAASDPSFASRLGIIAHAASAAKIFCKPCPSSGKRESCAEYSTGPQLTQGPFYRAPPSDTHFLADLDFLF